MNGKRLYQSNLATCCLCGGWYQRKTSKATFCCAAHRQRAYRLRKRAVADVTASEIVDAGQADQDYSPDGPGRRSPKTGPARGAAKKRKKNDHGR